MMTSGALLPTTRLISSRADLSLKSPCVKSSVPADEIDPPVQCVVLDARDPHRFLTMTVRRFLRGYSNCAF